MDDNKKNPREEEKQNTTSQQKAAEQRSGSFNEPRVGEEKSTVNPEEEAELEQERKEAMTERD
ncbi:MAG: hypothetical protein ACJ75F_15625 [Flavisolibacter sp.]|jgi:hypothetical protein